MVQLCTSRTSSLCCEEIFYPSDPRPVAPSRVRSQTNNGYSNGSTRGPLESSGRFRPDSMQWGFRWFYNPGLSSWMSVHCSGASYIVDRAPLATFATTQTPVQRGYLCMDVSPVKASVELEPSSCYQHPQPQIYRGQKLIASYGLVLSRRSRSPIPCWCVGRRDCA